MDRNTIVRVSIPSALYESVKGKIFNEQSTDKDKKKTKSEDKKDKQSK